MMQNDHNSLQQQQRLATLYAMQQQQQQQQQGRLPPQSFAQAPNTMYNANPAASILNNQSFRPQQQQQGMFMRPPGMAQGGQVMGPGGLPPKFPSPLQQQQLNYQQQQLQLQQQHQLQQQQFQLQQHQLRMQQQQLQQQLQQPTPPPQFPGRPAMVPTATTPPVMIGMPGSGGGGGSGIPIGHPASTVAPPGASSSPSSSVPQQPPPLPIETTHVETPAQKENLAQYQHRDRAYQAILNDQHKRHLLLAQEKKRDIEISQHERKIRMQGPNGVMATFGPGYRGLGNGTTGVHSKLIYPRDKKRFRRTPLLRFSLDDMKEQSTKENTLVPIRLEFEADGYKLRDTFTWNLNEQLVTPEQFAEQMCEDLRLPPASFLPQIARSIKDQVQDYYLHASSMVTKDASDTEENPKSPVTSSYPNTTLSNATVPLKRENSPHSTLDDTDQGMKKKVKRYAELRMLIKLDITVGHKALIDQFEWDINCPENSPEQFAEILTNDLGLGGEFRTAIAHSIREQVHVYTKSLLLVGHEFDGPVVDDDLKHSFLPYLKNVIRDGDAVNRFTPAILELSDAELQKNEKDRLREARRKRRQTRGRRGIILPDREPLKTNRTTHETQPEQEMTDEQFFASVNGVGGTGGAGSANGIRGSTPVQEAMHSQRRSALRARANIAAEAAGPSPGFMHTTF